MAVLISFYYLIIFIFKKKEIILLPKFNPIVFAITNNVHNLFLADYNQINQIKQFLKNLLLSKDICCQLCISITYYLIFINRVFNLPSIVPCFL